MTSRSTDPQQSAMIKSIDEATHIPKVKLDFYRILSSEISPMEASRILNCEYLTFFRHQKPDSIKRKDKDNIRYSLSLLSHFCTVMNCHIADILYPVDDPYYGLTEAEVQRKNGQIHPLPEVPESDDYKFMIECRLSEILMSRNLTVNYLSQKLNKQNESIRRLASNQVARIPKKLIEEICFALDISIPDLFSMTVESINHEDVPARDFLYPSRYRYKSNLDQLMKERSLSIDALVRKSGVPYTFAYQMRSNNIKSFRADNITSLATFLNVHPNDLLYVEEIEQEDDPQEKVQK